MTSTLTLARSFGAMPFEIFSQDTDEVILLLNYFIERANMTEDSSGAEAITPIDEKAESAAFWAAL